jgi:hypothetical protein
VVYLSTSSRSLVSSSSDRSFVRFDSMLCGTASETGAEMRARRWRRGVGERAAGGGLERGPYRVAENGLGGGVPDAVDVLQRELHVLLVGNLHTTHARGLNLEGRPPGGGLHHAHRLHGSRCPEAIEALESLQFTMRVKNEAPWAVVHVGGRMLHGPPTLRHRATQ